MGVERTVAVTGATGTLGRQVMAALDARAGITTCAISRRARPTDLPATHEWRTADLGRDDLGAAVAGADAIIHLASGKGDGAADVLATRRLLAAAEDAHVRHVVVISIIGCDRIPLPFYSSKLAIEAEVRQAGVPWSIVRVAQFHSFVERLVASAASLPVPSPLIADLRFQPVDERDAAEALVNVALGPPIGDAPEVAGPRVMTLGEIAATWLAVTGRPGSLVPIDLDRLVASSSGTPAPEGWVLPTLAGYSAAWNTAGPGAVLGNVEFEIWLRRRIGAGQRAGDG